MVFSNLSQTAQDVIMVNYEFFGKFFLIGFFFVVAIYYIFIARENQQKTPYLLLALFRTWAFALSWIYIFFTPLLTVLYLYPQQSIDKVLKGVFLFYRYSILLTGIIIFINLLFYAPLIIAKLGGLEIQSKNTSKVMDGWLGKYKNLFKK